MSLFSTTNIKAEALAFSRMASAFSQPACPRCQLDKSAFRCPSSCSRRPTRAGRRCSSPAPLQGKDGRQNRQGEAPSQGGRLPTPPAPSTRQVQVKGPGTVPTSASAHTHAHTPHTHTHTPHKHTPHTQSHPPTHTHTPHTYTHPPHTHTPNTHPTHTITPHTHTPHIHTHHTHTHTTHTQSHHTHTHTTHTARAGAGPTVSSGYASTGGWAPPIHHLICKTYPYLLKILKDFINS